MQLNEVNSANSKSFKYWVGSSSFFETALIFYPLCTPASRASGGKPEAEIKIIDCDGNLVNSVNCTFSPDKASVLEMSAFLEGFKYESGIKHGLAEIRCSESLEAQCRLITHSSASMAGNLLEVQRAQKAFVPLRLGQSFTSLLVLVNLSNQSNNIKGKLFIGKRSPEINITLNPESTRLISLAKEYAEYIDAGALANLGYLRASSKSDLPFAAQVIEAAESQKNEAFITTIL